MVAVNECKGGVQRVARLTKSMLGESFRVDRNGGRYKSKLSMYKLWPKKSKNGITISRGALQVAGECQMYSKKAKIG
jgi:hypothetical protein